MILVVSRDHPEVQIFTLLITSVTFQILLFKGRPHADSLDNRLALFNESMVSFYLYALLCMTDLNINMSSRVQLGWALVASIFLSVFVNFMKFFYRIGVDLRKWFTRWRAEKYKARKEQIKNDLKKEGVTLVHQEINPYAYAFDRQRSTAIKEQTMQSTLLMLHRVPYHNRQETLDIGHIPKLAGFETPTPISDYEEFMRTFKTNNVPCIEEPCSPDIDD